MYGVLAWELSHRWVGDAALFGVAAVVQLVGVARRPRLEPWLHLGSLALVLVVYGRFAAVALHIHRVFGPETGQQALTVLGASVGALPWVLAFPVARLVALRPGRVAMLLPLALLPALDGLRPYPALPGADQVETVANKLWDGWANGAPTEVGLPNGATARVTVLRDGVASRSTPWDHTGGDPLASVRATPPGPRDALLVDIAASELPAGFTRRGVDAPVKGPSPHLFARVVSRREVLPGFYAPVAPDPTLRWRTALVSADGAVTLDHGWAPDSGEVTPARIDAALAAAAAHLVHGMGEDGRFTYIVKGPSGERGPGYNYPRHAGTAWFLARVWAATGDEAARQGAVAALRHLVDAGGRTADGRAYVLDPTRKDGRCWIGTVALAVLAHAALGDAGGADRDQLVAYVKQLAASVDADGKVRGDMTVADGVFREQPANAYGQGQVMLALAAAERVGVTDGREALSRTIERLESGRHVGSRAPATVGDEHWACLAANAIFAVRGVDAGGGLCDAYVANERWGAPAAGGGLQPATGPGGGAAEALVARAWDTRRPALLDATMAWARAFLAAQYRPADAPLLGDPAALLGGFRDTAADLDVQIDAVQHIGGALLGVEALLSGRARPGSLP